MRAFCEEISELITYQEASKEYMKMKETAGVAIL